MTETTGAYEVTPGCRGLWYFAHPYTAKDPDGRYVYEAECANWVLCCVRSARLLGLGYNVYAPIAHTHAIHAHWPESLAGQVHDMWYQLDMQVLDRTRWDGIILAPGWEESKGCVAERAWFAERELRILLYDHVVRCEEAEG